MKALLVVDRRFHAADGHWLTEGPTGPETGERYLRWFSSVEVAGREGGSTGLNSARLNRVSAPGLNVTFLPNLSGITTRVRNLSRARAQLGRLIDDADCVIARLPGELPLEAAKLALAKGKPLAIDLGGCALDGLRHHGSLKGRIYAPISYRNLKSVVRRCQWVSYVTQEFLQSRYPAAPGATTVACSNVSIPTPEQQILDKRLKRIELAERPLTFGTIGSLHTRYKGVQDAIAALGAVKSQLPPFRYKVLGGGDPAPWRDLAARHGLADEVIFEGTLPSGGPVHEWLDNLDVYFHPSLTEGLPRAVVEAMSRGAPIIASSVGGTPELLPSECMHKPGDVGVLKSLILQSVSADWQRKQAQANWERAHEYAKPILEKKRERFWIAFAEHARTSS